jgi:hypothetical protein
MVKETQKEKDLQEIKVWRDRIERGKKLRKRKIKEAKKYIKYYKSDQWSDSTGYKEKPVTNLIFASIKSQLPFLYFQNPKWYVTPKTGHKQDKKKIIENAKTASLFLNYYANENLRITLKKQARLVILDAIFIFGAMKVGYVPNMVINENYGKPKVLGYEDQEPIYDIDDKGNVIVDEDEDIMLNEKFVARRVSPASFIFDTECQNYFEDGRYIIEEISLPLEDVKNDKKYKNTKNLKPSYMAKRGLDLSENEMAKSDYRELQEDLKRVTLYEIWDIEHDKLKVIAEGHDDWLRNVETPEGVESDPYVFLQFNDIPDEVYPLSDIRVQISPQDEYNKATAMVLTHAKRFNRKYGYVEGMIDEDQMRIVESGEDGSFFKVKDMPLSKVIEPLTDSQINQAVLMGLEGSRQNFDKVSVTNEADRGVIERRKTAFEANKVYGSSDLRKEDRRSLVEDMMSQVGDKLLQSMQANLTPQESVPIGGVENAQNWANLDKDNIEGQFNVKTEVGSMTPKLPESERQEFVQFMQVLTMFPPEMIKVKVNMDGILEAMTTMFPALEDIELINPPETQKVVGEQIQKQKQMEMMLQVAKMRGGKLHLDPQGQPKGQPKGKGKQPAKQLMMGGGK